ncbi:hypothetical protein BS47DRAFT_1357026 [Hydnum rufescens UP504]|uniref:Uncharacterized protein n=1 Tax=Hydnum rufescens UP504 TaxID=1448309 RepID=A0A9P6BBD8_9AGAM|nr:hypothetical protein BS47DRAFT_1357026 [Hydnum rufescens UP504]
MATAQWHLPAYYASGYVVLLRPGIPFNDSPSSRIATQDGVSAHSSQPHLGNPVPGGLSFFASKASASRFQAVSLPAPSMGAPKSPSCPLRLRGRFNAHEVTFPATAPPSPSYCFSAPDVPEPPDRSPLSTGHSRVSSVPPPSSPMKDTFRVNHSVQCSGTTKAGKRCKNKVKPLLMHSILRIHPPGSNAFAIRHVKDLPPPTKVLSVNDRMQCSALTRAGRRCKRTIKPRPLILDTYTSSKDVHPPCFCHQHVKDLPSPSGFCMMPGGTWINSDDRKSKQQDTLSVKIGRSKHVIKRRDQWERQCPSMQYVLHGLWPRVENDDGTEPSLLKGHIKQGRKGKFSYRWEHLMAHKQYLSPEFFAPNSKASPSVSAPMRPAKPPAVRPIRSKCTDCGAVHREIFTFTHVGSGQWKDRMWELIEEMIDRWGNFVELYDNTTAQGNPSHIGYICLYYDDGDAGTRGSVLHKNRTFESMVQDHQATTIANREKGGKNGRNGYVSPEHDIKIRGLDKRMNMDVFPPQSLQ